ncbi:MAG: CotH kinase family protein [Ruminococcus sp.]|nr:CotH kinase family protein [Ruminococcus sp.]
MKKLICLLLAVAMTAGCAADQQSSAGETSSVSESVTTVTTETTPTETEPPPVTEPEPFWPPYEADPAPLEQQESLSLPDFAKVWEQYGADPEYLASRFERRSSQKEHPCINIYTQDEQQILSKDEYVASVIDVFNCAEEHRLTAAAGVKVRGNSTADQGDEKPYRIKFEEKQNMLGLHGGEKYRSWVLLRSYWNLAPDLVGFSLAKAIFEGKYYSSDMTYVNLYVNDRSKGIYLLCEQNQAAPGRGDVYEPSDGETQAEIGYFIEMDNYPSEEHPYFYMDHEEAEITDISGKTKKLIPHAYSIKSRINSVGQFDFISNFLKGVFTILYEGAEHDKPMMFDDSWNVVPADGVYADGYEAIEAVIDTKSLANMLILEELVHNYDVGAGSFYMAIDFSPESKYPKLTFFAPWDFNWAYEGDPDGGWYACTFQKLMDEWDRSNVWFITAMKSEGFRETVSERFAALYDSGELQAAAADALKTCKSMEHDLGSDKWKIDAAGKIVSFVNGRIEWLKKQWM